MTPHAYRTTPAYASDALLLNLDNTAMTGLLPVLIMVFIISKGEEP